jgi:hypothetical protein
MYHEEDGKGDDEAEAYVNRGAGSFHGRVFIISIVSSLAEMLNIPYNMRARKDAV